MVLKGSVYKVFVVFVVLGDPVGFRKVRKAERNNFLQFSSKTLRLVPSNDKKTKKFTTINTTTIKV